MMPRRSFAAAAAVLAFIPAAALANGPYGRNVAPLAPAGTPEQVAACISGNNTAINYIAVVALQPRDSHVAPSYYRGGTGTMSDAVIDAAGANPIVLGLQDPRGKIVGYVEIRSDGLPGRMTTRQVVTALCETNHAVRLMDEIRRQVAAHMSPPENLIDRQMRDHKAVKDAEWQTRGAAGIKPLIDRQDRPAPR